MTTATPHPAHLQKSIFFQSIYSIIDFNYLFYILYTSVSPQGESKDFFPSFVSLVKTHPRNSLQHIIGVYKELVNE